MSHLSRPFILAAPLAVAASLLAMAPSAVAQEANPAAQYEPPAEQPQSLFRRGDAFEQRFGDRGNGRRRRGRGRISVPELSGGGVGSAATLLLGGVFVALGRRRQR